MRKIILLIIAAFTLVCIKSSFAQNILELTYEPLNKEFLSFTKTLKEVNETDYQKSIDLCTDALDKFQDMNIRNNLIFWELLRISSRFMQSSMLKDFHHTTRCYSISFYGHSYAIECCS